MIWELRLGFSFAEFVQARGVRLKVSDMINQAGLEADFQQLEEADKLSLLREWVRKYPETLAQNSGATNFSSYLTDISRTANIHLFGKLVKTMNC